MANEDTFNGAKNAFTYMFAYLNTVGQDIGMERALALDTKMCEAMGAAQGTALKQLTGKEHASLHAATLLTESFLEDGLGITSEFLEEDASKRLFKVGRCPLYEAAEALGMDSASIEGLCRGGAIQFMDTLVKQLNPAFSYQLREFRSSAEDSCVEGILLS
jgi:hypothetical protein